MDAEKLPFGRGDFKRRRFVQFGNILSSYPPLSSPSSFFPPLWPFLLTPWFKFWTPFPRLALLTQIIPFSSAYAYTHSSHGFCIGHITPEAQVGGPIALVKDGDTIHVDAVKNIIELRVPAEELERRRKEWKPHPLKVSQGTLYKYVKMVSDASRGCITDA